MNAFKFTRIGHKDSLDIRETFETPEGRRYMTDLFFINQSNVDFHDHVNEYPHLDSPCL